MCTCTHTYTHTHRKCEECSKTSREVTLEVKIRTKKSTNLSNQDLSGNICIQHQFVQYLKLCIIREIMPCWIQYFEFFANTNVEDLLLSGDVEIQPEPTNDFMSVSPPRLLNGGNNTCFANSSMQLLMSIPSFRNCVTNARTPGIDQNLQRIIETISDPNKVRTNEIFDCNYYIRQIMSFMDGMKFRRQHDAHEFLSQLFAKSYNSQLKSLFRVYVNEKIVCHSQICGNAPVNESSNPHFMLPLSLTTNSVLNNIADLLQTYFEDSPLPDYRCDRNDGEACSLKGDCTQSQGVDSLSDNLILQLKIFETNKQGILVKITNIPIQLDRYIVINGQILHLCGVIYHKGESLVSGHYFTEIYINGFWYQANDVNVFRIPVLTGYNQLNEIVPYILLYRKVENVPPIAGNPSVSSAKMHNQLLREFEVQKEKVAAQTKDHDDDFFKTCDVPDSKLKSEQSSFKSPGRSKKAKKIGNLTPQKSATSKQSDGNDELKSASSKSNLNDDFVDFSISEEPMDCEINEITTNSSTLKRKVSHHTPEKMASIDISDDESEMSGSKKTVIENPQTPKKMNFNKRKKIETKSFETTSRLNKNKLK